MSVKYFQNVIQQIKGATDRTIGIFDDNGTVVACNNPALSNTIIDKKIIDQLHTNNKIVFNNTTYSVIGSGTKTEYFIFIQGSDDVAENLISVMSVMLDTLKEFYDDKYNKTNFIKNIMLENILPGDIYSKSKELHLLIDGARVVVLIRLLDKTDVFAYDTIQTLFPDKTKDFVISVNDTDIALIKDIRSSTDIKDVEKLSKSILDTLNNEFYTKAVIGIGTTVTSLRDISRSFKEAQVAIEVGKVFDVEKSIISYSNLGIGRLIYYLPTNLCETFLDEVFKKGNLDSLDHETLFTIQKFFENNLNVSETSRKLFVHRNTLVYRLDKIRRITGLDLKEFDDAIVFKVALMVKKYMTSNPTKY